MSLMKVRDSFWSHAIDVADTALLLTDDVTQVLLAEVTDIILEPSIPSEFAKRTLEELIQRYKEDRFELPASKSQFRDLLSLATVHLGNILPDVLDVVRRGVKTFPAEVSLSHGTF